MNKVILQGRLTDEVDIKTYGKDGENCVANFTLACRDYKDADGEWVTQFIRCCCFNKPARVLEEFTEKGMPLVVCGKLRNTVYEDEDGVRHYNTQVVVEDFDLIVSKKADEDREDEAPKRVNKPSKYPNKARR